MSCRDERMFAISYKRLTFAANKMQQSCQEMNSRELLEYLTFAARSLSKDSVTYSIAEVLAPLS